MNNLLAEMLSPRIALAEQDVAAGVETHRYHMGGIDRLCFLISAKAAAAGDTLTVEALASNAVTGGTQETMFMQFVSKLVSDDPTGAVKANYITEDLCNPPGSGAGVQTPQGLTSWTSDGADGDKPVLYLIDFRNEAVNPNTDHTFASIKLTSSAAMNVSVIALPCMYRQSTDRTINIYTANGQ